MLDDYSTQMSGNVFAIFWTSFLFHLINQKEHIKSKEYA